jgi:glycogen operon protein
MIEPGTPTPLGAICRPDGVNFAIWAEAAERVELCLFDDHGNETGRHDLPGQTDGAWHGFVPRCGPGQQYGYRIHGPYAPQDGLRFNPNKLLIDPYARRLAGEFHWAPAVFDFEASDGALSLNAADSAPFVPRSVVTDLAPAPGPGPAIPWGEAVIYEANVRGYTMRHPDIPDAERGKFAGMANGRILEYLKALGITTIELLPVYAFVDEQALNPRGLRNFWGYNPISFFAPENRYTATDPRREFRDMVETIHDAGFEVVLDVVYNHTGESGGHGPTVSFRGIDNLAYYRTLAEDRSGYINDTGCGNTLNTDHPRVRALVLDSLRYWSGDMGVDGFRFDLAPVLGRGGHGFSADHPLLRAIAADRSLREIKLIAEPWDIGPGGYQLGQFPANWAEWNDRYRDAVRRFWRGDADVSAEFARRIHGSSDLFEHGGRGPAMSVNFISAHDGFTLADLVSYAHKHNYANGEQNRDGHTHNYSSNYGVEGATGDESILALRRRQRLNMLATLLLSQGTPMLLGGDELGNSQHGNNNAYAQDNEIGWVDWSGLEDDPDFIDHVRGLIRLRSRLPLVGQASYLHGADEISWWHPDGRRMEHDDWQRATALGVIFGRHERKEAEPRRAILIVLNSAAHDIDFVLPRDSDQWKVLYSTVDEESSVERDHSASLRVPARSLLLLEHR